jgi:hypothetical protein
MQFSDGVASRQVAYKTLSLPPSSRLGSLARPTNWESPLVMYSCASIMDLISPSLSMGEGQGGGALLPLPPGEGTKNLLL